MGYVDLDDTTPGLTSSSSKLESLCSTELLLVIGGNCDNLVVMFSSSFLHTLCIVAAVLLQGCVNVTSFSIRYDRRPVTAPILQLPVATTIRTPRRSEYRALATLSRRHRVQLSNGNGSLEEEEDKSGPADDDVEEAGGFDGEGFSGYLAPYAVALLGSIAVTFLVFKFVFLDY